MADLFNPLNLMGFFSSNSCEVNRSDILKPLIWFFGVLLITIIILCYIKAPINIIYFILFLLCLCFVVYLGTYIYALSTNPDLLRSEDYNYKKQKLYRGDSQAGLVDDNDLVELTPSINQQNSRLEFKK